MFIPDFPFVVVSSIVFDSYRESDAMGKGITLLLMGLSVVSWAFMLGKWLEIRGMFSFNLKFMRFYRSTKHPAIAQLGDRKLAIRSPIALIYTEATKELLNSLENAGVSHDEIRGWRHGQVGVRLCDAELAAIRGVAERLLAEQQLVVESRMGNLATITTTAPLLGLFGTVWGIMVAFVMMANSGSMMLSAVAPGIASALLTTVAGLVVAIPSTIGYNVLADRIRAMTVDMENFVDELMADVTRIHGSGFGN